MCEAVELGDEARRLVRSVQPAQRMAGEDFRAAGCQHGAGHLRFQKAGQHAVAAHIARPVFECHALGQADETGFGGGIGSLAGGTVQRGEGANVDDVAAALPYHELEGGT